MLTKHGILPSQGAALVLALTCSTSFVWVAEATAGGSRRFHENEEVEMAIREQFRTPQA
jgi:hypothetical protein